MPDAMIATPVVFGAASYGLRVSISGVAATCTFTVTAGRFYWMVGDAQADAATLGGVGDLLERLRACIASHPSAPTVTVTLDANFNVRVSVASGTIQILWTHGASTLDEAIFGFANADTAVAAAVTGTLIPQGLWRPGRPIWEDGRPQRPMVGGVARSVAGRTRVSYFGTMDRERSIYFGRLLQSVVLTEFLSVTNPTGSLEYHWLNSIGRGRPFRLYEDETSRTSSSYTLWRTTETSRPFRRNGEDPPESIYWNARWLSSEVTS